MDCVIAMGVTDASRVYGIELAAGDDEGSSETIHLALLGVLSPGSGGRRGVSSPALSCENAGAASHLMVVGCCAGSSAILSPAAPAVRRPGASCRSWRRPKTAVSDASDRPTPRTGVMGIGLVEYQESGCVPQRRGDVDDVFSDRHDSEGEQVTETVGAFGRPC